ncbi:unnamed protein product, partial [Prorocentrum cordatum]
MRRLACAVQAQLLCAPALDVVEGATEEKEEDPGGEARGRAGTARGWRQCAGAGEGRALGAEARSEDSQGPRGPRGRGESRVLGVESVLWKPASFARSRRAVQAPPPGHASRGRVAGGASAAASASRARCLAAFGKPWTPGPPRACAGCPRAAPRRAPPPRPAAPRAPPQPLRLRGRRRGA